MAVDLGQAYTDKEIEKLTHKINGIYKEAQKDINKKMKDFNEKYKVKEAKYAQQVKDGKITQEQFDNWKKGQVFQGKAWQAKKDEITTVLHNSNVLASQIINDERVNVFGFNFNYASYSMEHSAGVNFGFGIYDKNTVINLIRNEPNLLPAYTPKKGIDKAWNSKKITRQITQGIIQGEKLDQIADRLAKATASQDRNSMLTHARTLMTGAQNAGRLESYRQAEKLGIDMEKEWMATLDGHTRDSHADIDGERQPIEHKFTNDCMYPGDPGGPPAEVYNCRCTMVSNIKKYPDKYKRRDNINGKPIDNMSYKEWYKAKYGKDFVKKVKGTPKVNYKKFGGEENFETLAKYSDWMDMLSKEDPKKYEEIMKFFGEDTDKVDQAMLEAKQVKEALKEAENKAKLVEQEKAYEKAKEELVQLEQKIKDNHVDKVFEGIWKDQKITYADYEAKKHTIEAKTQFYEAQIKSNTNTVLESQLWIDPNKYHDLYEKFNKHDTYESFLKDTKLQEELAKVVDRNGVRWGDEPNFQKAIWDIWNNSTVVQENKKMEGYIRDLEDFKKHGEAYSKLLQERDAMKLQVQSLKPHVGSEGAFSGDVYSQARKDAALWAKSSKEADTALRPMSKEAWQNASDAERHAAWDYTAGSGGFNRPLRGYEGNWHNFKGIGQVDLNYEGKGKEIEDLTNMISRSTLQQDTWLQRGIETLDGLSNFLQVPESDLRNLGQEDLEKLLLGKEITDQAFMSCGSAKGTGFSGSILNVYCPEGTQAIYCEPFSRYGNGDGKSWDGKSDQSYFGSELETLLQRGSTFKVTKVEKSYYGKIYIDLDLVDQRY